MFGDLCYISVLAASANDTGLTFQIQTTDLGSNVTLTLAVSSLSASDSEIDLAKKIETQLKTKLAQTDNDFAGVLFFPTDTITTPTFNVTRTDHIVCIASQAAFDVEVTTNTTGSVINLSDTYPTLMTLDDARDRSSIMSVDLVDSSGTALTDTQLALLLEILSSELISYLNNPIAATTYWKHETTEWQSCLFLRKTPIINYYAPYVRKPILFFVPTSTASDNSVPDDYFQLNPRTGELSYRYYQNIIDNPADPFAYNNEVAVAYVGGYRSVPTPVKTFLINSVNFLGEEEFKSLQGGTLKVEPKTKEEFLASATTTLNHYFLSMGV